MHVKLSLSVESPSKSDNRSHCVVGDEENYEMNCVTRVIFAMKKCKFLRTQTEVNNFHWVSPSNVS